MERTDPIYDEACRVVGQCCLMMAQSGLELSRARVADQLKQLLCQISEQTDESRLAIALAIEQLDDVLHR